MIFSQSPEAGKDNGYNESKSELLVYDAALFGEDDDLEELDDDQIETRKDVSFPKLCSCLAEKRDHASAAVLFAQEKS